MRIALAASLALAACAGCPPDVAADGGAPVPAAVDGGTVGRLFFAMHGDTRPGSTDDTGGYPTAILRSIYAREAARKVQFAVDLGDHVDASTADAARAQMKLYLDAASLLGAPTYMTMGNHECGCDACGAMSGDPVFGAFRDALAPVSPTPYYRVDVATGAGRATLVMVADNAWDDAESAWLSSTLADTDAHSRYVIVARHHPLGSDPSTAGGAEAVVRAHRYTLLLTGHKHEYRHDTDLDPSGRTLRMGNAGAPLAGTFYGYGTVEQQPDDSLTVTIYDQASDNIVDAWSVRP